MVPIIAAQTSSAVMDFLKTVEAMRLAIRSSNLTLQSVDRLSQRV